MPLHGDAKREYQRRWIAERRSQWIQSQGGICVLCGSDEQLEIDHKDRSEKQLRIGGVWSLRQEVRDAELAKCQVLCKDCHTEKTRSEMRQDFEHGTPSKYRQGCKCRDCVTANSKLKDEQRKRRKSKPPT